MSLSKNSAFNQRIDSTWMYNYDIKITLRQKVFLIYTRSKTSSHLDMDIKIVLLCDVCYIL